MPKVIIYTQAYNAAATLPRTIQSVLNQSYTDWIWILIDNGSTDDTARFIAEAAGKDCRIIPYALFQNKIDVYLSAYAVASKNYPDCYLTQIDADDEFKPEFLQHLLDFSTRNNLDVACGGTVFARLDNNGDVQVTGQRKSDEDIIIEGKDFAEKFIEYKTYTNELWGKIFKLSVINPQDLLHAVEFHYDSINVFKFFKRAKRVGILSEALYYNFNYKNSLSTTIFRNNLLNGVIGNLSKSFRVERENFLALNECFKQYRDYLLSYGEISDENTDYLYAIYIDWIHSKLINLYLTDYQQNIILATKKLLIFMQTETFIEAFQHKSLDKCNILSKRYQILEQMRHYLNICKIDLSEFPVLDEMSDKIKALQEKL